MSPQHRSRPPAPENLGIRVAASDMPAPTRNAVSASVKTVARQLGLVVAAVLVYFGVRALTEGSVTAAVANGGDVLAFERRLGIQFENAAQDFVVGRPALRTIANWIYIWGHWPFIVGSLVWLYRHQAGQYRQLVRSLIVSGTVGLIIFATFPVAPPRLMPNAGFADTVTTHSHSYRVLQPPSLVNAYAAVPSFHVGWNALVAVALISVVRHRGTKLVVGASPLLMWSATIVTGNHYFVDGVAGIIIALTAFAVTRRLWPTPAVPSSGPVPASITPPDLTPRSTIVTAMTRCRARRNGAGTRQPSPQSLQPSLRHDAKSASDTGRKDIGGDVSATGTTDPHVAHKPRAMADGSR